jgi:hypothetical protein
MYISDNASTYEDVLDGTLVRFSIYEMLLTAVEAHKMWILQLINNGNVVKLKIQILIDALQGSFYRDIVFKLDRHLVINESFEKAMRQSV